MRPDLIVTQQNILAKSLGSNTIPWCLTLSSSLQSKADLALQSYYFNESTTKNNNNHKNNNSPPTSWNEWKRSTLSPAYLQSFHKNFDSGDYSLMRSFWGTRECNSQQDIPPSLSAHVRFESRDCVSYETDFVPQSSNPTTNSKLKSKSESNYLTNEPKKMRVQAWTLRGVLLAEPAFINTVSGEASMSSSSPSSSSLALELFDEIVSLEENVFDWSVRGPRIFQSLVYPSPPQTLPLFHTHYNEDHSLLPLPDIIALQEYDVHSAQAVYRNVQGQTQEEETFAQAMRNSGYSGVFFSDPLLTRDPPSGIAVYFKHELFELCDALGCPVSQQTLQKWMDHDDDCNSTSSTIMDDVNDDNDNNLNLPWTISLECGKVIGDELQPPCKESSHSSLFYNNVKIPNLGPAVINIDMMEHWTPIPKKSKISSPSDKNNPSPPTINKEQEMSSILMKCADRRNAGFLRLRERQSPHRILHVATVHLMTTSRDGPKTNQYPGEVRAGEIAVLKDLLQTHTVPVTPTNQGNDFEGNNRNSDDNCSDNDSSNPTQSKESSVLLMGDFNTCPEETFVFQGDIFSFPSLPNNSSRSVPTGFESQTRSFQWTQSKHQIPLTLQDAFSTIHSPQTQDHSSFQFNDKQQQMQQCTSRNADRASWIDYIYHTNTTLQVVKDGLSNTNIPESNIPNEKHGSDHLPLTVGFHWH